MNTLDAGSDFEKLPETYLIFITRNDVLGRRLPIYHIRKKIDETDEEFKDGAHIIYVNSAMQDDTELGRLMHDFHCKSADEMYSDVLAARVRALKETQEGVERMCKEMEEIYNEGREEGWAKGQADGWAKGQADGLSKGLEEGLAEGLSKGREEGRNEGKREAAFNLSKRGMKEPDIADILMVHVSLVKEWLSGREGESSVPQHI